MEKIANIIVVLIMLSALAAFGAIVADQPTAQSVAVSNNA